jgi:hypothetical protein
MGQQGARLRSTAIPSAVFPISSMLRSLRSSPGVQHFVTGFDALNLPERGMDVGGSWTDELQPCSRTPEYLSQLDGAHRQHNHQRLGRPRWDDNLGVAHFADHRAHRRVFRHWALLRHSVHRARKGD